MPLENKRSNRFNLKTYIVLEAFNADSIHTIKIDINKKVFFEKALTKNHKHNLEILDYFDFREPGLNNIEITWTGEQESADKFIKIYKIIINDQYIAPHSVMITPLRNEYINNLLTTQDGIKSYRKKILNPGNQHGWYGRYKFKFSVDANEIKKNTVEQIIDSTGIEFQNIYSDVERQNYDRKVN